MNLMNLMNLDFRLEGLPVKKTYDDEDVTTTAARVRALRQERDWSQKELADKIFVTHSQISRVESGETTNINSQLLVTIAKEFHVSTDYLLGLTPVRSAKSYDISAPGLSEEAVHRLLSKSIDTDVLNRLLEHPDFPKICVLIKNYFCNTTAHGIMSRNEVIDLATEPLTELRNNDPSKRNEITKDLSFIKSQKLPPNEADIEKIKSHLMKLLRDIKADMEIQKPTSPTATADAMKSIWKSMPHKYQYRPTNNDVANAVTAYVGKAFELDNGTAADLHKLVLKMTKQPLKKRK